MSLLSTATRSRYLKYIGIGEYSKQNVLKFQRIAFTDPAERDGKYGAKTDKALRHWYNVKKHTKNFSPQEFRCPCGKCTGYPTWMKSNELKNIQAVRDHYGKPVEVTSALRCVQHNRVVGGVSNSKHLEGRAIDFYIPKVTSTLSRRKAIIDWMKRLPKFRYAYCNGYNSYGENIRRAQMGSAIHLDSEA